MPRLNEIVAVLLLALSWLGCGEEGPATPSMGVGVPLSQGGFVPWSTLADLRGSPTNLVESPGLWLPQPVVAGDGWGPVGQGWHPVGERSSLRLWRRAAGGSSLLLDLSHRADISETRYQVAVTLNGRELGTFETAPGRVQRRFELSPGVLAPVNALELAFEPAIALVEGPSPVSLLRVGVVGGGPPPGSSGGESGVGRSDAGGVVISRSGAFVVPLDIPESAVEMELRTRNLGQLVATHRVNLLRSDGEGFELVSGQLTGKNWQQESVSVEAFRGQQVVLSWELELAGADGLVELAEVRFLPETSNWPESEPPISNPASPGARKPDVLLIILDAARGDRFPGWKYFRQTMPNIDRLAEQAMSFRRAFAECPTTSCSVPAMITGIPFLAGGEVGGGTGLADEILTLAEYLAELGYRTVGFSATPNNSASHNLDQGFETFRELWGKDNPDHGPFNMSRLASEIIRDQPADRPLYLQLHYLPPHQPYNPGLEFDRFTAPGYAGAIRPDMSLKPYSLGLEPLEGDDLDYLVGLYDGNLSVADAAVAEVLATLRATDRFDNTVIVITSDHGEAFMEHGRQGHNTTLFDEMLHVPLLVRLPGGTRPASVDADRLASVLDIVPTVLGVVGAEPGVGVGGVDLLHTRPDPLRPRVLFFRTSHPKNTMLAARTSGWKAISWPRHQVQMLFDLVEDPGESNNLVGEKPLVYAGLGLRIRRHLERSARIRWRGAEAEMTEEAKDALRALGYLD